MTNIFKSLFNVEYENGDKRNRRIITFCGLKIKYRPKNAKITTVDKNEYIEYVLNNQLDNSCYVSEKEPIKTAPKDVKLIAYYLPQYHAIPENDKWFGKGFTEWYNVAKTVPQYKGHWQPHLPIDVGFYNLETLDIMKRQIKLAKNNGIGGFCYYYYWFNGQKLLEKPIEKFLEDKTLDMPFCLFWDSSHWTQTWNGGTDKDIMYEQKIEADTAERFMQDFLKYAKDERYIKFEDKPVLVISSPNTFNQDELKAFIKELREISKKEISQDLYIMTLRGNSTEEKYEYLDFDAMLEFFPLGIDDLINRKPEKIMNEKFTGSCFDMEEFVEEKKYLYETKYKTYKSCFPNWDNTARKCYRKGRIFQSTPELYKKWLKDIIDWTRKNHKEGDRYVFINAWNEWAEGAHLEPDQKYGYAFLEATKEALEETAKE